MDSRFLIIGAGPTGLGAACRLQAHGEDWHLLEATDRFGGLAGSFEDDHGFTWDYGGHVQFSHYDSFDQAMDRALGAAGWIDHERESWVWMKERFIPYPFQNNLHRLDPADRWACVEGLYAAWRQANARGAEPQPPPEDFEQWMLATFGPGITDLFMRPYNFKVWAYPGREMDFRWIGERVAVPDLDRTLRSICLDEDAVSWGPNATFRFPRRGGTGSVWRAIGESLPAERVSFGRQVTAIDPVQRRVTTAAGDTFTYERLLSTMPLNQLVPLIDGGIEPAVNAASAVAGLRYSATNIVGIGLDGTAPDHLRSKCWMYFPEDHSPYYRVTVFSNYSPNNVARPGEQWSLMTETAESGAKPVATARLIEDTVAALHRDRLIPDPGRIVTRVHRRLPQGYPTPFKGRDSLVDPLLRALEARGVWSRGRFGAWKYEVSNQDHSFAQGYEWVERMRNDGGPELEPTLHSPNAVNARRNP